MGEKEKERERERRKREIRAFNDKWGASGLCFLAGLLLFIIVLEALSIKNSGKVIYRNLP